MADLQFQNSVQYCLHRFSLENMLQMPGESTISPSVGTWIEHHERLLGLSSHKISLSAF